MEELITFSELIDKLSVINIKLYNLLEKTAELDKKELKTKDDIDLIVRLSGENIRLAKQRSNLKSAIDKKLNEAIKKGGTDILDEVKNYNR
jgi:ribosome-associated translation inhibitor RaiA